MVSEAQSPLQKVETIDSGQGYRIEAIGVWKVSRMYYHDVPITDYLGRFQFVKIDDRERTAVLENKFDKVHQYRYTELIEVDNKRDWVLAPAKIPEGERGEWEQEYREEAVPNLPGDAYARQLYARKGFRERPKRMAADGSGFLVDTPLGPVNEVALRALIADGQYTGQTFGNSEEEFKKATAPDNVDSILGPGSTEVTEAGSSVPSGPVEITADMLGADPELRDRAMKAMVDAGMFSDKNGDPLKGVILQKKIAAMAATESEKTPAAN